MANVFSVIGSLLESIGEAIVSVVAGILERVLRGPTGRALADGLLDFARFVVGELAAIDTLTNDEKRAEAIRRIRDEADKRSAQWQEHAIRLAIELAVSALKS